MLDDLDRRVLRNLQADPDIGSAELAERVGTSSAVAWRRVQRMKDAGVIRATVADIDWAAHRRNKDDPPLPSSGGWTYEACMRCSPS